MCSFSLLESAKNNCFGYLNLWEILIRRPYFGGNFFFYSCEIHVTLFSNRELIDLSAICVLKSIENISLKNPEGR